MNSEEEMMLCFVKAGVLMRSLAFCTMDTTDTSKTLDEFLVLADKIRSFIKQATGKDNNTVSDMEMELIQDERLAALFVYENIDIPIA